MARSGKKSVIDKSNPALQFITAPKETTEEQPAATVPTKAPEGYKLNPLYVEIKSRRLQLVLQPSLYERVKAKAVESGLSVNEFCHKILDEATREE